MLNFARVLMILAGVFGLPAVACSGACSAVLHDTQASSGGKTFYDVLLLASLVASVGAIFVGAKAATFGKAKAGLSCLLFAAVYLSLLLQLNMLGLGSAFLLLLAAIMVFVSPDEQFRGVVKVEVQNPNAPS